MRVKYTTTKTLSNEENSKNVIITYSMIAL